MDVISILKSTSIALDLICLITNGYTLFYICTHFSLRIHVFTLAFVDSFLTTSGCLISTTINALVLSSALLPNHLSCSISTMSFYLPQNYGIVLMLEVAVIRYYLAIKASQCEYPPNMKVLIVSVLIFVFYAAAMFGYIALLTFKDIPYSFLIEFCSRPLDQVRPLNKGYLLSIQVPFLLNFVSLIVDFCLVKFLRKNSLKEIHKNITLGTINRDAVQDVEEPGASLGNNGTKAFQSKVSPTGTRSPNLREEDKETIPMKGTVISAGFVVLSIIIGIVSIVVKMDDQTRALIIKVIGDLFRAARCPLIAFVTYKARKDRASRITE